MDCYYRNPDKPKGKSVNVSVSVSCFVPKPFTPFQWEPQDTVEELARKQRLLRDSLTTRKISLSWHDANVSFLEAVLARGDRRLGRVLEEVWRQGGHLDAWTEHLSLDRWREAFAVCGLDPAFYANRRRPYDEVLPWDHLDFGVSKAFLIRENQQAHESVTTPNCREACSACGAACFKGGICVERR